MLSHTILELRRISRILWVRVSLILGLAILSALLTPIIDPLIPQVSKDRYSSDATLPILNIIANGMLAVTTFSLGIMVTTHRATADQTTPRIHRLLMDDTRTQSVLATFIGAFVFALVSIILYRAGYYTDSTSVIVFFMAVLVVAIIVVSIVRWIDHLSQLGSMDYALERAEQSAKETLESLKKWPALGAQAFETTDDIPKDAQPIIAVQSGYLRLIDMERLGKLAAKADAQVYIDSLPGDTVLAGQTLAWATGEPELERFVICFSIEGNRSHEQDARYAIQCLRETASKALAPGINDPGTAVEVVVRLERLLWDWVRADPPDEPVRHACLHLRRLRTGILLETAFGDIIRDGASFVDVLLTVNRALTNIGDVASEDANAAARSLIEQVLAHGMAGLRTEVEKDTLRSGVG